MTIEEKAIRYDEVKNKLSRFIAQGVDPLITRADVQDFFPELAGSKDEKIRKEIKTYLENILGDEGYEDEDIESWIAWLERQKPVEHLELKEGHWYICHRAYCCRADNLTVREGERFMCEKDGVIKGFVVKDAEKYFKECNAPYEDKLEYIDSNAVRRQSTIQVLEYARSLDSYNQYGKADIDKNIAWLERQGANSPVLSNSANIGKDEQKQEWSEEDKDFMYDTLSNLTELKDIYGEGYGNVGRCIGWLKSLKLQPKQSLDEDTQQWIDTIIKDYEDLYNTDKDHSATIQAKISILKSLRPQSRWKPSDEQMEELEEVIESN